MPILTIRGEIDRKQLGLTLTHEHLLFDPSRRFENMKIEDKEKKRLFRQKVSIENLSQLRFDVLSVLDNVILGDVDTAVEEVLEFKKSGGCTIVDQTNEEMGRDAEVLRYISEKTGLNIILSTGYYIEGPFPIISGRKV